MKKIVSIILALVLTAVLFCGAVAETADITGVWYGNMFGAVIPLTLNEDGTYIIDLSSMGYEDEEETITTGTWSFDGTNGVMDEGTEVETAFTVADDSITVEGIVFTRDMPEAFESAPVKADAVIEDFAGTWNTTLVGLSGLVVPPEEAGMDLKFVIDGTKVTLDFSISGEPSEEEAPSIEGTFADGILTVIQVSDSEYVEDTAFVIKALEDGTLDASMELFGMSIDFYLSKAE